MSQFWHGIQNVVVVGLGVTGLSVVRHLQQLPHELNIRVNDSRATPPGVDELPEDLECHVGAWQQDWLLNADLLVVNPGIALATPVLVAAKQAGVKIVGDIELFAWAVADMKNPPHVVAITGSNGKSTVTDLTGVLANAAGMKAYIGGNIGVPALDLLNQAADLYVLELSSFQLETTDNLHLDAAAFLNFTEDHMDRYDDLQGYLSAKQRIFKHANAAVANRDDVATYPDQSLLLERKTFGTDAADYGLIKDSDGLYLAKDGAQLIDVKKLSLVGLHNYTNVLVVFALLESLGAPYQDLLSDPSSDFSKALCQYQGLSHRCQLVTDNHGVRW
ncbi:MAG: UDP-N-acetylmuramoyl-L-alanine--D-glutamate ligase, partial [Vibrio sp.]